MNSEILLPYVGIFLPVVFVILSVFINSLLDSFSVRLSMGPGSLQSWMFNQLGQSLVGDFFIAFGLQFFSFRKKAFFTQLLSFINVGSFTKNQILVLFLGSFIGMGFSVLVLAAIDLVVGLVLCFLGIIVSLLFRKKTFCHAGPAMGILGFILLSLVFFDQVILNFPFGIQQDSGGGLLFFCLVVVTTLFFRTPIGFLISLSALHSFIGLDILWFPLFFFFHWLFSLFGFYRALVRGHQRLYFAIWTMGIFQVLQLIFCLILFSFIGEPLVLFFQGNPFLSGFQICILAYFIYFSVVPLFVLPFVWMVIGCSLLKPDKYEKQVSQKIIFHKYHSGEFSIHLSLFLLKQEFKKYVTTVHTLLKLVREANHETREINKRLSHYQGISTRVSHEIKQLCSAIGCQYSCDWQARDILRRYHQVNLIEQLTKDLSAITSSLKEGQWDTEWERECRFWLGLQLKLFEFFLNIVIGMDRRNSDRVQAITEKSYGILERFSPGKDNSGRVSLRTFYRVTENIESLLRSMSPSNQY